MYIYIFDRFNTSVFAIEYPGYGPAEGTASEESVNDNLKTAYDFLLFLGYPSKNIILMGYSIGTGIGIGKKHTYICIYIYI
jgi:pimeloyl-ACP methyl ester carboxylesterase